MTAAPGRKTVVSVTPIAIERDSRTLRQAASLARFGYRSIVVEGERSRHRPAGMPFELVTPAGVPDSWAAHTEPGDEGNLVGLARFASRRKGPLARALWFVYSRWFLLLERLMPGFNPKWWVFRSNLVWSLRLLCRLPRADLYIVHSPRPYPAVALRRALARGARHAYDAHDAYFEREPGMEQAPAPPGEPTWERLERRCVRGASFFITVSEGVAGLLEQRFGRRPSVVRNCQDTRLDRPAAIGLRERLGLSDGEYLLVSIGNHKPGMTETGLEALLRLPADVHLALVGRGYEELRDRVAELGLDRRVHLAGPAPSTELASLVGSADAAVLLYYPVTRDYERALPNRFFHAMAAGLPTLYPEGLPEVVSVAECYGLGLPVDPRDPKSIAAGVSRLRADRELAERLRAAAERASELENWEHEEPRFISLVEGVLGTAARPSRVAADDRTAPGPRGSDRQT